MNINLTQEERDIILDALEDKVQMWIDHNKIIMMHGTDDRVKFYTEKNNAMIERIKNLSNRIKQG